MNSTEQTRTKRTNFENSTAKPQNLDFDPPKSANTTTDRSRTRKASGSNNKKPAPTSSSSTRSKPPLPNSSAYSPSRKTTKRKIGPTISEKMSRSPKLHK